MKCVHCGKKFNPNPRIKNQEYCSSKDCQKARRAKWQRENSANDPDYKDNQRRCWKEWLKRHPDYYREYRRQHPEYVERNRLLQIQRNARKRKNGLVKLIAKMDSLRTGCPRRGRLYNLVAYDNRLIAKMDPLMVELIPVEGVARL